MLTMMEKLTVDGEGKIVIPPEVIQKRGLHPGDELTLVESAEGLLVYQGIDEKTSAWWNRLNDAQRMLAEDDARRYESLANTSETPPGTKKQSPSKSKPRVTNSTFQPTSVLLDKGVITRVYERRVRLALGEPPTVLQVEAANSYAHLATITNCLYITEQTASILKRRTEIFAAPILADTRALKKARYLRRWLGA